MRKRSCRAITDAQLQALVAVAEHGSFTTAARQLNMSQSAVSHAVSSLEQALELTLVRRTTRGIGLTEAGERIARHARQILRLKERIHADAEAIRRRRDGSLLIGSFGVSASRRLLPPLKRAFAKRYPAVAVMIHEGSDQEVEQWLRDGDVEVGFVALPNEEFDTMGLWQDEMNVLLPADHVLATQPRIRSDNLESFPFIMSTGGCEAAIRSSVPETALDVRHRIRENDTIVAMVVQHVGISILPTLSLPDPLPGGIVLRPLEVSSYRQIALAVKKRKEVSPACEAFLKLARAQSVRGAT